MVIKDPVTGQFFRLRAPEQFIAQQLDGATPLEEVQRRVEKEFGAVLAPEALSRFLETLDHSGLLEKPAGDRSPQRKPSGRMGGSLLYLRFRLLDPDRLLNAMARRCHFLFTPGFVFLSATAILGALAVTLFNWNEIVQDAARLYRFSTLPVFLLIVFLTVTTHEFAHGLTCKHFGGEVREMGLLLLYFQPAFYCNVSDAWLFPEKSRRLWVGFAGPYFELFLWALATLAWRLTDTETWISHFSLVVMATSGIKTLFNFNPLIKLDGYYLLSDYLGISNLREKSLRYLGQFLRRIGGLACQLPLVPRRERRIYLAYGLAAWTFSAVLLIYLAMLVGPHLIVRDQRVAFLAFTGLIGLRVRNLFNRKSANVEKRTSTRRHRWLIKLLAVAALLLVLLFGRMELRVAGPLNVLPLHNADVRAPIEGIIEEIHATEGQRVHKGHVIARLSDREHRAELQKVEAEIQQCQARLDMLRAGPTPQQIDVARRTVATAEDRFVFAQGKVAREKPLFDQSLIAASDFDVTRQLESGAKNELAEAKSKLQVLLEGTRPEEIEAARAEFARLEAQRRYWNEQLKLVNVLSPSDGIITTPSRQLTELPRQMVQKGDLIAKVHELDTVTVEAAISEKEIADVKPGQTVAVKVRAHPERLFYGKVTAIATTVRGAASINASAAVLPANTILVTTEIDNAAHLLKPGMTGMAKIYCGERRVTDLVLRRLSRTFRVEFWSWW